MKICHLTIATLAALFLLIGCTEERDDENADDATTHGKAEVELAHEDTRADDAATRAKANVELARDASVRAFMAEIDARRIFLEDFGKLPFDLIERSSAYVEIAKQSSSQSSEAHDKAKKFAREAAYAATHGLTDRAIEAAFNASEAAIAATEARDMAVRMRDLVIFTISEYGVDTDN